jgi:hypothetical protein
MPRYRQLKAGLSKSLITELKKDDEAFAEIEAKRIEKKLDKEKTKSIKVWEKSEKREGDGFNVRKKILEIKNEIRNSDYNFLEKKNYHFSKAHR